MEMGVVLRLLDEPVLHESGGFEDEIYLSYVAEAHGGPCALRYCDRQGEHWAIFPTYGSAATAASGASRSDIGGYANVAIYPLSAVALNTPRYQTSTDWLFGDDAPPEAVREQGVHYRARIAMRDMIRDIAARPEELFKMEWVDLERALYEALNGLGYQVGRTRSTKDGGYDLEVKIEDRRYLIEVKHWNVAKRVGPEVVRRLGEVVLREQAQGGLVLSSSGFSRSVATTRFDVSRTCVMLGDSRKMLSFCQSFVLSEGGIWQRDGDLTEVFFAETF
jgi:hypothetical protein